jgi:RNA polymerase sigma-70 factor (sigma-E family)
LRFGEDGSDAAEARAACFFLLQPLSEGGRLETVAKIAAGVEVAVAGFAADFESIYARCHLPALRLATLLTGNTALAEDVAADVFARVYVALRRSRINDPDAYVRRAVVNDVISRSRRRRLEQRHQQPDRHPARAQDSETDRLMEHNALVAALQQLPPHHRVPLVLRYFQDLTEAQTAAAMRVPVGTVKSSVARGLRELRAIVGEEWR